MCFMQVNGNESIAKIQQYVTLHDELWRSVFWIMWRDTYHCTCVSTSMAMSINISWSSLMLDSSWMMSLCRDSISFSACLVICELEMIWRQKHSSSELIPTLISKLLSALDLRSSILLLFGFNWFQNHVLFYFCPFSCISCMEFYVWYRCI